MVYILKAALHEAAAGATLDDKTVKCWGGSFNGQLGDGDILSRGDDPGEMGGNLPAVDLGTGRTAVYIATRGRHICGMLHDAVSRRLFQLPTPPSTHFPIQHVANRPAHRPPNTIDTSNSKLNP